MPWGESYPVSDHVPCPDCAGVAPAGCITCEGWGDVAYWFDVNETYLREEC